MAKDKCYYCGSREPNLEILKEKNACPKCIERYEANRADRKSSGSNSRREIEEQFKAKFLCRKCGKKDALTKRIATTGDGLSRIFDLQLYEFLAISCKNCGLSEIYDFEIIESKDDLTTFIDLIFST